MNWEDLGAVLTRHVDDLEDLTSFLEEYRDKRESEDALSDHSLGTMIVAAQHLTEMLRTLRFSVGS